MPASSVPAGQSLQNHGSRVTYGIATTSTPSVTVRVQLKRLGSRSFGVGILYTSSWNQPKGQNQPQLARPISAPTSPTLPRT